MKDFICSNCGNNNFSEGKIDKVFNIEGKLCLVENIPAFLCNRCQEPILTIETTEHIRFILKSNQKPSKIVTTQVYEFS